MNTIENLDALRIEKQEDLFNSLEKQIDIDFNYCIGGNIIEDFDELTEKIEDNGGFDCEVIYYANAIEYLKQNDPSLQESFEIASEYGFSVEKLNSETLASLLKERNLRDDYWSYETEIENSLNDIEEWYNEELDKINE